MNGITVGVPACNEELNILNLLFKIVDEAKYLEGCPLEVIISSSSTDNTNKIVQDFANEINQREISINVKLLIEKERGGKAAAINNIIQNASHEFIILEDADTLPIVPAYIHHLKVLLANKDCGVSSGRYIPTNNPNSFFGFCAHSISELHHLLCLQLMNIGSNTKVDGSFYAFRKDVVQALPFKVVSDDEYVSWISSKKGYRSIYTPEARILKSEPGNLIDYIKVRKRVLAGHYYHKQVTKTVVPTVDMKLVFPVLIRYTIQLTKGRSLKNVAYLVGLISLESICRVLAQYDVWQNHIPYIYHLDSVDVRAPKVYIGQNKI